MKAKDKININVDSAIAALKNDGVIIIPTDTLPGIGCNIMSKTACEKIYNIKQRPQHKPLAIFVPNVDWIFENCIVDEKIIDFCHKNLPGAYTLLLKLKDKNFATKMTHGGITENIIGIRIPDNTFCLEITKQLYNKHNNDIILCATSVNLSGMLPAKTVAAVDPQIAKQVDYIENSNQDGSGRPSTIIDFTINSSSPIVVR